MQRFLVVLYVLVPLAILVLLFRTPNPDPAVGACKGKIAATSVRLRTSPSIPPATQTQKPIPAIARLFKNCAKRIENGDIDAVVSYLENALAVIEAEHGRNSVAYANALTLIISFLNETTKRDDLIRPLTERSVSVSREVYGADHRETANALFVHAIAVGSPDGLLDKVWTDDSISLIREALGIRRRLLGANHRETIEAESELARALFSKWKYSDVGVVNPRLLDEAEGLAQRAHTWHQARTKKSRVKSGLEDLLGRIAYARGDYEKAAAFFGIWFGSARNSPLAGMSRRIQCAFAGDTCEEYVSALRKLGRDEEAAAFEGKPDNGD